MIDTDILSVSYEGNDSTATGYLVTFPFLSNTAYVKCAVQGPDDEEEIILSGGQYSVHLDGSSYSVRTATAYDDTYTVRIYRELPLTQPLDLPQSGAVSPPSLEAALDRLTMIAQQIAGGTGAGGTIDPEALQDVMDFADAAARAVTAARRAGQLAVQLDDNTLWISQTTTVGDWELYPPAEATPSNRLVFLATADAGIPGTYQDYVITRAYDWAVNGIICGGDNHYTPATFEQSWAAFAAFITDGKVDRALGNHDASDWTADNAKFAYLPTNGSGNRRYYKRSHGSGLLDIFVLHSGRDSSWNAIETDGNYEGSTQHAWFAAQVAASTARWKIAVMHHPPVTASGEANRADVNLDWPEFAQLDGILVGHVHFCEWLTCRGTPLVNVSGGVNRDGDVSDLLNLTGVDAIGSDLLWHDDRRRLVTKLTVTPTRFLVAFHRLETGELVYQRDLTDKTAHRSEWGAEIVGPGTIIPETGTVLLGICPVPLCRGAWVVSVAIPGASTLAGNILVDGAVAGSFTIAAGEFWAEVDASRNLRRGARVQVQITTNTAYGAWYGLAVYYKGQMVG